jgi:hypothetical protein
MVQKYSTDAVISNAYIRVDGSEIFNLLFYPYSALIRLPATQNY